MIGPGSLGSLHTDLVILVASNSQHTLYLQIYHNLNTPETSNSIEYSVPRTESRPLESSRRVALQVTRCPCVTASKMHQSNPLGPP